jgi:hypothetical protein
MAPLPGLNSSSQSIKNCADKSITYVKSLSAPRAERAF